MRCRLNHGADGSEVRMRKLVLLISVAAVAAGLAASPVAADPPLRFDFVDDFGFPAPRQSAMCGTPIVVSFSGTGHILVHTAPDGSVREQDFVENWLITYSAPATGKSLSYKLGPSHWDYPDGVYVGAPATITFLGVENNLPGRHATAGRLVVPAQVIAVVPPGIPIAVQIGPPISRSGTPPDTATFWAAFCGALTG